MQVSGNTLLPTAVLEKAMHEAVAAALASTGPFGAVLLDSASAKVTFSAFNTYPADRPVSHAETNVLRTAMRQHSDLGHLLLVSTVEPCAMCASAAVMSGVSGIVFGTSIDTLAAYGQSTRGIRVPCSYIVTHSHRAMIPVKGGILRHRTDKLVDDWLRPGGGIFTSRPRHLWPK